MGSNFLADLTAERSILGNILIDPIVLDSVYLKVDEFSTEVHKAVFKTIRDLASKGTPPDLVAVSSALQGEVPAATLAEISSEGGLLTFLPHHCQIVRKFSTARKLAQACREIMADLTNDNALDLAESKIMELREGNGADCTAVNVRLVLGPVLDDLEDMCRRKEIITGVPTGFHDLDRMTAGLQPSDLIIVAARPSMGKTAMVLNILEYAGLAGRKGLIFSLEMSKEQLVKRLISSAGKVDGQRLRTGQLLDTDWSKLTDASGKLADLPVWIDDSQGLSLADLRAKARRHKRRHGLDLLAIDYLQLMRTPRADRHDLAIGEITRSLKGLAKELNVPVVCLSQLSRDLERRTDKRPIMADLRDSGAIEQDADLILFPFREAVYCDRCKSGTCDKLHHDRRAELIIAKQRSGPTGAVKLVWMPEFSRFGNLDEFRAIA